MSETVSIYPTEVEEDRGTSDNYANQASGNQEIKDPTWGDALRELVSANADTLVKCPWMGGSEVTVSQAMTAYNYPPNLTAEDEPFLISVVMELLANRVEETQAQEEEEKPEEETAESENGELKSDSKAEAPKPEQNLETKTEEQPKDQAVPAQAQINPESNIEKPAAPIAEKAVLPTAEPAQTETKAEAAASPAGPESQAPAISEAESIAAAPLDDEGGKPAAPPAAEAVIESEAAGGPDAAAEQLELVSGTSAEVPRVAVAEEDNRLPEDELAEIFLPADSEESEKIDDEGMAGLELEDLSFDELEFSGKFESREAEEEGITLAFPDDEIEPVNLEAYFAEEPIIDPDAEQIQPENVINIVTEDTNEAGAAVEKIQELVTQLAERIELDQPEAEEDLQQTVDKITEVSAKLEASAGEGAMTEEEAQTEAEELFSELLQKLEIDYTPEAIEYLAYFTLHRHLATEHEKATDQTEAEEAAPDYGTHEIIAQLLAGLSATKKSISAGVIGQYSLRLYSFSLAAINT